jgi:gas vesicle protein
VGFLERNKALSDLSARESSVWWANLLISLLIILIETAPVLSKLIMTSGPYDIALAGMELRQMAAAEEEMRRDREMVYEKKTAVYGQKKEMTTELLQKLAALQKKHVQEELDQWERGEDKIPGRMPLEEVTRRIKKRYDFQEDDIL